MMRVIVLLTVFLVGLSGVVFGNSNSWPVLKTYEGERLRRVKMPIGGIGTGTVSLSGRGALVDWEIRGNAAKGVTPNDAVAPAFLIRTETADGKVAMRLLEGPLDTIDYEGSQGSPAANHGFPRFRECSFKAAYPFAQVCLRDRAMPVAATLEAMNPLVPGDEEASGIPAALLRWRIANLTDAALKVSVCGILVEHAGGETVREAVDADGLAAIRLGSKDVSPTDDTLGEIALAVERGCGEVSRATRIAHCGWMVGFDNFVRAFAETGRAADIEDPAANGNMRKVAALAVAFEVPANGTASVPFALAWRYPHRRAWISGFPVRSGAFPPEEDVGNHYATVYPSALAAAKRLFSGLAADETKTRTFVSGVLGMKAPDVVKEAALFNLSTFRTETCFRTKDGHFYGWEGVMDGGGSCYGNCTHVWGYEHALIDLWPRLAKDMTETQYGPAMTAEGRMRFRVKLPADYSKPAASEGSCAADGQMQCIVKAYENWKKTGDDAWIRGLYPRIRKSLEFAWRENGWDGDRDGVMEGCQHNTMDVDYVGPNPQMEFLYLAALKAMAAMAGFCGEPSFAAECRSLAAKGAEWTEKNLFNGEYYEHIVRPMKGKPVEGTCTWSTDPANPKRYQLAAGCLVDQLVGDYAARHVGLGPVADEAHARRTLDTILLRNASDPESSQFNNMRDFAFPDEPALKMAWYPPGRMPAKPFPYYVENMTGFEYVVAANLAQRGDFARAEKVVRDIRSRYDGRKRNPFDEAECGHHYARALAAWSVLKAWEAPRGTEWQDCRTFGEGRLPPRAWFGHFPDAESAKEVRPERSPWQISLDSETAWRFRWSRRPEERPVGFFRPDYDVSGWDVVKVPCSWQAMGIRASGERFGTPIYVNHPYIFTPRFPANVDCPPRVVGNDLPADWTFGPMDNPIGSYRREFELPSDWAGSQVVIRFDGVESFYYLWVNGHYLGFAKNSRGASEFDVTDFVRLGTNTVALEVYRNSDGSYLECQDIYRLSGILRSVSVHRRPKTHLEDVRLVTRPWTPGAYEGDWALELDVVKTGPDAVEVGAEVFDAMGGKVPFEGDVRPGRSVLRFARPRTWTAETPNLHTLVVTLARNGKTLEAAGFDLGFREVAIRDDGVQSNRVFTVNGRPVKLKGVNRGETDPLYGHYVPDARMEQDLRLIKEGNFNHIRCSHMPQPPYFYYLCNRYGIYVMDEANLETHGLYYGKESLSNRPEWREAHVDRQRAMYGWDKNFPCIVYWSLGNEAGPGDNFRACAEYLRMADGTRPVQYERNNWIGDSGACMYPSLELVARFASAAADAMDPVSPDRPIRYPYYLLEYAHSFNNSCGNLADYQALIESSDRMLGGSIWDWADQSLWKRTSDGRIVQAWGGCFGEKPEEGQGIMDGIVTTDRRPDPNYYEAKHVFQNFTATLADGKIRIRNKNYFRDSSGYDCRWTLLVNGEAAGAGTLAVSVGPQECADIPLPEAARTAIGKGTDEVALRVQFALRDAETVLPKGWIVAEDQLELVPPRMPRPLRTGGERPAVVRDDAELLSIRSGDLAYAFSKVTGELVSLKRGTHELLKSPVTIDCFRVPVGGESHCFRTNTFGLARLRDGLRNMKPTLASLSAVRKESDGALSLTCVVRYRGIRKEDAPWFCHGDGGKIADCGAVDADAPGVEATSEWRFCGDDGVALRTTFRPFGRPTEFSRMGWRFVFDEPETDVRYFALGPHDNYPDRRTCCFAAVHSAPSTAFGFRYGVNQDNGTRGEARWVELAKPGVRFDVAGDRLFSFAVTPYSPTELMENAHPEINPDPVKTELGLYAKVRGLGSGNCGPEPLPRDRIAAGETCVLDVSIRQR